jgi:hypothetical protein
MLKRTPALASETSMAEPPWLMNVSGIPVSGAMPTIDARLINASTTKYVAMPVAR